MSESPIAIFVPGRINPRVLDRLKTVFDVINGSVDALDADQKNRVRGIAVSGKCDAAMIDAFPNLEVISSFGVGYDGTDTAKAAERGIIVTNTPDVLNDEVADTAIALLLNTLRQLPRAENYLREGRWAKEGPFALSPLSLKGRSVGILGLGRIGLEIARRLEPFKVTIGYHTRSQRSDVGYTYYPSLKEMAGAVDTLINIAPGTPSTFKIIDTEIFKALGPNGVFINVGRGSSVDEEALVVALRERTIAAAGLDVFFAEPQVPAELIALDNASLLPHVASASVPTRNAMADLVVDNLIGWFKDKTVLTPVPETPVKK
ncbi:2-hydroxyacid dehydrogenase [Neorhizobium alkalisoli]|uniref:Lactate dehydrogenase-like 2-hydroxyacid dehydrogenase n=1 Tax=Neorhizobium alkalisoli TaxID=528178 RepID=A0A561QNP0_9HYPH|nr:2-hydroxyacid dehydrogenase [Neorhizobium alkalisoli]TWF51993.1 lactate dehydrogenase-like 2-hydroxyacid dehydrogenase [Neorhizobium alkalisoli]